MEDYPVTTYCTVRSCRKEATHEELCRPLCNDHCTKPVGCTGCGWWGNCEDTHACETGLIA